MREKGRRKRREGRGVKIGRKRTSSNNPVSAKNLNKCQSLNHLATFPTPSSPVSNALSSSPASALTAPLRSSESVTEGPREMKEEEAVVRV